MYDLLDKVDFQYYYVSVTIKLIKNVTIII